MFDIIAFDADDTLWHNEPLYRGTQRQVCDILSHYHEPDWIERRITETEIRNLEHYGYGAKGFTLSMIETAIDLTEGRISGSEIRQIMDLTRAMLRAPVELLAGVKETIVQLADDYELMVITKGDLFEQEAKIARSGLGELFKHIEIVPTKTPQVYGNVTAKYGIAPHRFLMIGNSLKSDILPVLAIGGSAIHIPYETTWEHELVPEAELIGKDFIRLTNIAELPALLAQYKIQ